MMGSGPWRMLADDGHVAYCFLMGASTNQKTVCYAAYHPQMLLIIQLTRQSDQWQKNAKIKIKIKNEK